MITTRKSLIYIFGTFGITLLLLSIWSVYKELNPALRFNGQRALQDVIAQVSFGSRTPGSTAHGQTIIYIQQQLEKSGWKVQIQASDWLGFSVENIIAFRSNVPPQIIIGAHYDSRLMADQEKGPGRIQPVPGANDGASGVAVLLELARSLPSDSIPVWLVFFDAEDNGGIDNRQWIMGSNAFVTGLTIKPQGAIIVDMVGDANLNLYIERNSDMKLSFEIWGKAAQLGYKKYFIATPKYDMIDDHTPFLEAGIPAVDIIDFDYTYWHTTLDTIDKVSAKSLQIVGDTLWAWLDSQK